METLLFVLFFYLLFINFGQTVENEPLLEENENVEDEDDYEYECDGGDDVEEIYGEPMEDIIEEEEEREDTPQVINLLPPPSPKITISPSKDTETVQNKSASKSLKKKVCSNLYYLYL